VAILLNFVNKLKMTRTGQKPHGLISEDIWDLFFPNVGMAVDVKKERREERDHT